MSTKTTPTLPTADSGAETSSGTLPCFAYASVLDTPDYQAKTLAPMDDDAYRGFAGEGAGDYQALVAGLRTRLQARSEDSSDPRRQEQGALGLRMLDQLGGSLQTPLAACLSLMKNEKGTGVRYKLTPKMNYQPLVEQLTALTIAVHLACGDQPANAPWATFFNKLCRAPLTYLDYQHAPLTNTSTIVTDQREGVQEVIEKPKPPKGRRKKPDSAD